MTEAHGGHGPGHLDLGDLQVTPGGEIHSLPEGSVLAENGSTISWSQAATGALTAIDEDSKQLVVSRYRPSKTAGADMLHGGDLAVGDAVPPAAGPGAGDQPLAQVVGNLDPADANAGDEGEHDPIRGTRFAYSEQVLVLPGATPGAVGTVNQGDPYLTVTYVTDETDKSVSVDVVGLLSSVSIRMKTNGDDATHVPGTVHATYPHHQSAEWHGNLDVTKSPVKMLTNIQGWQLDAFKEAFRAAAYFDTLAPVVAKAFDQSDAPTLKPKVIAKDAEDVAVHAVIWGGVMVAAAIALAPVSAPLSAAAAATIFFGSAVASSASDLYDMAKEELQQAEPEAPPNPDVPDDEHPDDECFAEGTVVALANSRYVPIERITVGDVVASRQESSLEDCAGGVTRTWKHEQQRTVDIRLDTGERVRTPAPHRFFTLGRGIVPVGELNVGDSAVWVHNDKDTKHDDPPPPDPDGGGDSGDGGAGGAGDPTGDGGAPPGGDGRGASTPA